jgi:hypothetical protein
MITRQELIEVVQVWVPCEECLTEIPLSAAAVFRSGGLCALFLWPGVLCDLEGPKRAERLCVGMGYFAIEFTIRNGPDRWWRVVPALAGSGTAAP